MEETTNTNMEQELTGLVKFDAAKHAIVAATSLDEVKDIRDRSEACRVYAKQAHLSLQMQNQCAEIRIRAERRAGEILMEMDKNRGGWDNKTSCPDTMSGQDKPPKLSELGISYKQSSRWQYIASIPEQIVEEYINKTVENKKELTSSGLTSAGYNFNKKQYIEAMKRRVAAIKVSETETGIFCSDCIPFMKNMDSNQVHLTLTGPPCGALRDYYINHHFGTIIYELGRIIKPNGIVVWVVDDYMIDDTEAGSPFQEAEMFKEMGFILWDTMIHHKIGTSYPLEGRYSQNFEYMFVFCKLPPLTFNRLVEIPNKGKGSWAESRPLEVIDGPGVKKLSNVWSIYNGPGSKDDFTKQHPATFPEQLARDHILSWTNPGDLVFDPFVGSGTTCKMAKLLGRRYIGVDISEEYCDLARRRIAATDECQK